jgi:hypothetical protein
MTKPRAKKSTTKKPIEPIIPDAFGVIVRDTRRSRDEVIETWRERAAIREYDGGYSRAEAETLAMDDTRDLLS